VFSLPFFFKNVIFFILLCKRGFFIKKGKKNGLQPVGNGLQPVGNGLQPVGNGLQPVGNGL
jgi:hypothetical protein